MAQAVADKQVELTNSQVQIQIAANQGDADLAKGRKKAEQSVVEAEADRKRKVLEAEAASQAIRLKAEAESQQLKLLGEGEGQRVSLEGEAQARVLARKIGSYGDPRLYALSLVAQHLSQSKQPLVPERLFMSGANGNGEANGHSKDIGLFATLIDLLIADKVGLGVTASTTVSPTAEPDSAAGNSEPKIKQEPATSQA